MNWKLVLLTVTILGAASAAFGYIARAAAPTPLAVYADAVVGPAVTFSAGFDASKYKLQGEPKLWAKPELSPIPAGPVQAWILCKNSTDAAAPNCGNGHVNVFFNSKTDGVGTNSSPWGQLQSDGKWIVTAQALPPAAQQNWRVRIELDLVAVAK
jgi:hypothetical protein